jgi:serine/threonine protein kinase/tetratricopeptide (TPR) repeat protein
MTHAAPQPARYATLREIFHRACDLDPEARAKYLDAACGDDAATRREIESLFALERSDLDGVLHVSNAPGSAPTDRTGSSVDGRSPAPDPQPERIGRYRLLEPIGEGGFGTVYLAEQTEPVVRRVALKIIKAGLDAPRVLARFESERQTLAVMDHPNIARLFDAGTTDDGRPFFVMELVQGEPVTTFCDRERCSVARRLELFRIICGAVQHAHHKGIVHRDLKPSNVLVTMSNGMPEPKVIDFGIAGPSEGTEASATDPAEALQLVGTLRYMSPEQAAGSGTDIDTRSDVYALGVLLYELLTGSTPLESTRVRTTPIGEIRRQIREEEPELLSQRLAGAVAPEDARRNSLPAREPLIAEIAHRRATDVKELRASVRGDLEEIVRKCLHKDRESRYPTASALAEDVGRFLNHEPVLAVPWSQGYRVRRFVRRNRAVMSAAVFVAAMLVIAAAVSFGFALREARQRTLAERASLRAQSAEATTRTRAEELDQAVTFLQEMLSSVDVAKMGIDLRASLLERTREAAARSLAEPEVDARIENLQSMIAQSNFTSISLEALEAHFFAPARAAIDAKFQEQPLVRARLLQTLASTLQDLGMLDLADEPQQTAVAIRRRELGEDHADTLVSLHDLGNLLREEGKLAEAEPCIRGAMEGFRRVLGDEHPSTLVAIGSVGLLARARGDFASAEACYREALDGLRRVRGDTHSETLNTLNNMGSLLAAQSRWAEAAHCFREVLESYRSTLGSRHASTLLALNNVATALNAEGRIAEAESCYREVLDGRLAVLGGDHPDTLASLNSLGVLLHDQGRYSEAEPYYREALAKRRLLLGAEHSKTLNSMNNMAGLLKDQGRLAEAEPLYREALAGRRRLLGDIHPETLNSIHNLGWLLEGMGRPAEAEEQYRTALDGYRRVLGDDHRDTLITIGNLGALLLDDCRPAEAVALLAPAEPALRRQFTGGNKLRLGRALSVLGRCRAGAQEFDRAETDLVEAHEILSTVANATSKDRLTVLGALVDLYGAWESAAPCPLRAEAAAFWRAKLDESQAAPKSTEVTAL